MIFDELAQLSSHIDAEFAVLAIHIPTTTRPNHSPMRLDEKAHEVCGVFDNPMRKEWQEGNMRESSISSTQPYFSARLCAFATKPTQGDVIYIPHLQIEAAVLDVQRDMPGRVKLTLELLKDGGIA